MQAFSDKGFVKLPDTQRSKAVVVAFVHNIHCKFCENTSHFPAYAGISKFVYCKCAPKISSKYFRTWKMMMTSRKYLLEICIGKVEEHAVLEHGGRGTLVQAGRFIGKHLARHISLQRHREKHLNVYSNPRHVVLQQFINPSYHHFIHVILLYYMYFWFLLNWPEFGWAPKTNCWKQLVQTF